MRITKALTQHDVCNKNIQLQLCRTLHKFRSHQHKITKKKKKKKRKTLRGYNKRISIGRTWACVLLNSLQVCSDWLLRGGHKVKTRNEGQHQVRDPVVFPCWQRVPADNKRLDCSLFQGTSNTCKDICAENPVRGTASISRCGYIVGF